MQRFFRAPHSRDRGLALGATRVTLPGERGTEGEVAVVEPPRLSGRARAWPRRSYADAPYLLLLLLAYLVPLLIVSPVAEYPLIDDWNHALSVRRLVERGELWIADWTATTLVFQVFWGALFAWVFGFSFTALRFATLVLSFAGSAALYALCREFGVPRPLALLGALTLWFNPIVLGLSYTFMSDVPFLALYLLSTLFFVRGVRRGTDRDLLIGACCAGLAFLVRHQGALVPLATLAYGVLARWPPRLLLRRGAIIAIPPALAVGGYLLWSRSQGLPQTQGEYITTLLRDGPRLWLPALKLAGYIVIYLGLFWLPLALGLAPGLVRAVAGWPGRHCLVVGLWAAAVAALVVLFAVVGEKPAYTERGGLIVHPHGWLMPYLKDGSMIHPGGLAPDDLRGARRPFMTTPMRVGFTVLVAGGLALLGTAIYRRAVALPDRAGEGEVGRGRADGRGVGLLALIGLLQFAGIYLPSVRILGGEWLSFDRYLLPLAPLAIALGLWGARGVRLAPILATVGLLGFLAYGLIGTQDWLAYNRVRWELGQGLVASGVPLYQIDGGMEWDGWFLYEYSRAQRMPPRTPNGPFWTYLVAPAVDSTYVIAFSSQPGYEMIARREYDSWLHQEPVYLYVLKRQEAPRAP